MRADLFPTNRDPLRRLGTTSLVAGLLGVLAIVYMMVHYARNQDSAEAWMLGVGVCLLLGAVVGSLVQGVLLSHQARIEVLEKLAEANRPAGGTPA
jgi:hypothetical protein